MENVVKTSSNVQFYSVADFKTKVLGLPLETEGQVVRNPKTNKLFFTIDNKTYRCKQEIDFTKSLSIAIGDGVIEDACLINTPADNVLITL